ncbi:thiol-disulfide oxidoreductase DCC family protein [Pseudoalteromonas sp.]|uniref:thiol-disulfide oxidoreductase DCC family protein n=1 Tax=Pseudoalteromonas sp. TaxID=53249 RepID=UPI0030014F3C
MIIFYDANCPLCAKEMRLLKKADKHNKIALEDINAGDFEQRFNHIKRQDALAFLHGQQDNGEMIYGLDVTFAAWQTVGRHKWLRVLQLPGIRFLADQGYKVFAKYRTTIAGSLCKSACGIK